MISDDDQNKRKKSNYSEKQNDYNRIFLIVERLMQKAFKDLTLDNLKPGVVYSYGFDIQVKDDGKPRIEKVKDYKRKKSQSIGQQDISNTTDTVFDFIEYFDSVTITTELIGADKKDIYVSVKGKKLTINIDQKDWRCKETIELPCEVRSQSLNYSFNNGVLDIELKKKFLFN